MRISDWSSDVCSSDLADLERARQDILYAQADTQNVRRRMEKEIQDARAYAATGFARDILSIADNLGRALAAIPEELREDEKVKGIVIGVEATGKELESVFRKHGIEKVERSEEHTSELQSLMRISYAVFCLKKQN